MPRASRRQRERFAGRRPTAGIVVAAFCALLVAATASAERRDYQFTRVGADQGLLQRTVQALVQDDQGYIWIATQAGLQRFDGRDFQSVGVDADEINTLPESFITALALDGNGQLWVGTNSNFLAAVNLANGRIGASPVLNDPLRDRAIAILAAPDNRLLVATAAGVEQFDPATGERTELMRLDRPTAAQRGGMQRDISMAFDTSDRLLVGSPDGLFRIDTYSRSSTRLADDVHVLAVHRDTANRLWIGTTTGLLQLGDDDRLRSVTDTDAAPIPPVRRIASDSSGHLWIGLQAGGLIRFDPTSGVRQTFDAMGWLPGSLHDPQVTALMVDQGGLLWVGGESFGLATTPIAGARFSLLIDPPMSASTPASNDIRSLFEGEPGTVWAGTSDGSLKEIEVANGNVRELIEPLATALALDEKAKRALRVVGLAGGEAGHVWVATDQGLLNFDPSKGSAQRLQPPDANAQSLTGERQYRTLLRGRDGTLWLGTAAAGLLAYTPETGAWRSFSASPEGSDALSNSAILSLFEDQDLRLWIGTLDGLFVLNPSTDSITRHAHRSDDPTSISDNLVRAVLQARDGRLWIASHGGLDVVTHIDSTTGLRVQRYGTEEGLPSATVYGLLEDDSGKLWLSTNLGITRFNPANGEVLRYGMADGLQNLEFNGGAQLVLRDGQLMFGGLNGINVFNPEGIRASDYEPPVVLTRLQIGARGAQQTFLRELDAIDVPQSARLLRMRFAALDFAEPQRTQVEYRLDGFDTDWVGGGTANEATYTNLDPGRYLLRVRGSNSDGIWSEHELQLPLRVIPEWWNSTLARFCYASLVAFVTWLLWSRRNQRRTAQHAMARQLAQREERLKLALWGSGDEFWDWDIAANVVHRIGADQLLGRATEEEISTDDWRSRAVHPDDLGRVQALLQAHITGQTAAFESEHRVRNASGTWLWVRSRGKVVERDVQNNALRIAGTARDITYSRHAERDRRIASEVLSSMSEAVAVVDLEFRFVSVNPAFSRITGYAETEVLGKASSLLDSAQQEIDFYHQLREITERDGHWKGEIWQRRKSGDEFLGWIEISEVRDNMGARTHYVTVVTDITDQKRAELELRYLANYDTLTGLPNRTLLGERLERAVARARRANTRVAVLFLDLDRFKDINDSMGHAAGDRLLKAAAARLQDTVREVDTVARLGGDEFTVVLEDVSSPAAAEQMAARIVSAFEAPLEIEGRAETSISPSIGVALYPDHASSPSDLLKFADTAMYQAKDRGRNTWQMYTEAMDAETRRRASMMAALRKALDRGEFSLLYQPKLSLQDGRITGVEALLRWQSDELGPVSPATFIPLAEETGLIVPIGEWVLREAVMALARWRRAGFNELVMAVNISVLQLLRGQLSEHVAAVLEQCNVPANRLELEVTESMVMANAEQAILAMRALKDLGVSLAIDDFGTGYSSLIYLKRLPIDTLKIDKAFVGDLTTDPDDEAITATIITMAHSLGLNVVAEGTETKDQIDYLTEQGCDEIQGYWLSWPIDDTRCLEFIRDWRPERLRAVAHKFP